MCCRLSSAMLTAAPPWSRADPTPVDDAVEILAGVSRSSMLRVRRSTASR